MNLSIETLSHPPLEFYSELPLQFPGPRLPGGEVLYASGAFGDLCLQEFNGDNFIIRYSVIRSKEKFLLGAQSHHSGVHVVIMMRNHISPAIKNAPEIKLGEGQFTILQAQRPEATMMFDKKQQYSCFEILLSEELTESLLKDFPQLAVSILHPAPERPDIWVNPAGWTDQEVKEHIGYVLHYSDKPEWRRNYFENRVWDIVWKLLAIHSHFDPAEKPMKEEEKEKAALVQQIILDNLQVHLLTRELAKKAGTSESKLKRIFMKAYGMGMHEYRIYQRLKKAIQLINEGLSVKEAAVMTGWRSADLIKAYNKVYNTTPGTLKKKK